MSNLLSLIIPQSKDDGITVVLKVAMLIDIGIICIVIGYLIGKIVKELRKN
jgi:hypothetical protein